MGHDRGRNVPTSRQGTVRLWAVLFWLLVWQAASMAMVAVWPHGDLLLASPLSALARLWELARTAAFWLTVGRSAGRILGGFLFACTAAVLLAILAAWRQWIRELLAPLVAVIKTVPVVSFIILALVWLDAESLAFFISALMVFPPVYLNVLEGVGQADRRLLEMARVFRVPFRRTLWGIWLPQVLPYLRSALSLSLGLCWKAGIAAEVIGLPAGTIGERLYTAKVYFQTPDLFAWTAVIAAVSVVFERLFVRGVDLLARKVGRGWK